MTPQPWCRKTSATRYRPTSLRAFAVHHAKYSWFHPWTKSIFSFFVSRNFEHSQQYALKDGIFVPEKIGVLHVLFLTPESCSR